MCAFNVTAGKCEWSRFFTHSPTLCATRFWRRSRRRALSVSCAPPFFGVSHPNGMQREPRQAAFEEERLRRRHVIRLLSRLAALHDVCQQWLPWKVQAVCAPDLAKRVGITCGFPGQKKTERVNCTPGDGLMQVKETAVVGTAQRPGSIPRPQPSATTRNGPRSLALCLHGKLGTWLRSASELHLDRQTSSRTPTMVQLNQIEC